MIHAIIPQIHWSSLFNNTSYPYIKVGHYALSEKTAQTRIIFLRELWEHMGTWVLDTFICYSIYVAFPDMSVDRFIGIY